MESSPIPSCVETALDGAGVMTCLICADSLEPSVDSTTCQAPASVIPDCSQYSRIGGVSTCHKCDVDYTFDEAISSCIMSSSGCRVISNGLCTSCKTEEGFFATDYDEYMGSICQQPNGPPPVGGSDNCEFGVCNSCVEFDPAFGKECLTCFNGYSSYGVCSSVGHPDNCVHSYELDTVMCYECEDGYYLADG